MTDQTQNPYVSPEEPVEEVAAGVRLLAEEERRRMRSVVKGLGWMIAGQALALAGFVLTFWLHIRWDEMRLNFWEPLSLPFYAAAAGMFIVGFRGCARCPARVVPGGTFFISVSGALLAVTAFIVFILRGNDMSRLNDELLGMSILPLLGSFVSWYIFLCILAGYPKKRGLRLLVEAPLAAGLVCFMLAGLTFFDDSAIVLCLLMMLGTAILYLVSIGAVRAAIKRVLADENGENDVKTPVSLENFNYWVGDKNEE